MQGVGVMREDEKQIIEKIVDDALAKGYEIAIISDGDLMVERTFEKDKVMAGLGECDEEYLHFWESGKADAPFIGWIFLVYGNEPGVVISDYVDNQKMNDLIEESEKVAANLFGGELPGEVEL